MIDTKLIIVFGVSGIGKTTLCQQVAKKNKDIVHYSASSLLSLHRKQANERTIEKAMGDQSELIELVRYHRAQTSASFMLLDAHSIIIVSGNEIIIPNNIIKAMNPNALFFLKADGHTISKRRILRGDKEISLPEEIEKLQDMALKVVKTYAEIIDCPLKIINTDQKTNLTKIIKTIV